MNKESEVIPVWIGDVYTKAEELLQLEKEQNEFMFECGRNFQLTGEGTFEEIYKETYEKE